MKLLLRRFGGIGLSDGLRLFNREGPSPCRALLPPSFLQSRRRRFSIDPIPCRRQMQTLTQAAAPTGNPSGPSEPTDQRWVILDRWAIPKCSSVNVMADDKTVAECRTSSGRPLRFSLGAVAPPAISFMCVDLAGARSKANEFADKHVYIIAAHGSSVLFRRRRVPQPRKRLGSYRPSYDYFVYRSGAGGRPASLSLLPACCTPMVERDFLAEEDYPTAREFDHSDTGILWRGDDELLVVQLKVPHSAPFDTAELCVLRPGRSKWEHKMAVPIIHTNGGKRHDLQMWQETHVVVPVGDRFLCWVNFDCSTFLLCDMADEEPKIRYVPLPVKPFPPKDDEEDDIFEDCHDDQPLWLYHRSIGAVGPEAVRFISIDNRCCCGAHVIRSSCEHSSSAFMVTMWTLALRTAEPMKWVKEAVLDCEEVWSLAASKGLPRVRLTCPVVSMENPDVVCFMASEGDLLWTVDIDVRRKTLISATPCPAHPVKCVNYGNPLPAKLHSS